MIVGLAGYAKSGKNTVAEIIKRLEPEWEIKGFSDALKQVASIMTGIPPKDFDSQETKAKTLGGEWDTWAYKGRNDGTHVEPYFTGEPYRKGMTVRELLQKLGTEAVRNNLHEDAWVNALFSRYYTEDRVTRIDGIGSIVTPASRWIITDVRFPNELNAIKQRGGIVVRITRPGYKPVNSHPSETALDDYLFEYYINNNGDLNYLETQVKKFLYDRRLKESIRIPG